MVAPGWAGGVCVCGAGSVLVEVTAEPYCMRVVVVEVAEVVVLAEVVGGGGGVLHSLMGGGCRWEVAATDSRVDARVRMYDKVFAGERVFGVTIAEVHEGHEEGGTVLLLP